MYILIGGAGYLGKNIIDQLIMRGVSYKCLDVLNEETENTLNFDMSNPSEKFSAIASQIFNSTVILLAAASSNELVNADPQKALKTNTTHLLDTVQELIQYKPAQIIFASSEWVYAADEDGRLIDDYSKNTSAYGRQKIAGEIIVRDICEFYGIPYFNARFGITWGKRKQGSAVEGIIQKVFDAKSLDNVVTVGHIQSARRFIHVEDLVYGLLKITPRHIGTYDITGSEAVSILDIANTAGQVFGRKFNIRNENKNPSIRLLSSGDIKQPDFTIVRNSFNSRVEQQIKKYYVS